MVQDLEDGELAGEVWDEPPQAAGQGNGEGETDVLAKWRQEWAGAEPHEAGAAARGKKRRGADDAVTPKRRKKERGDQDAVLEVCALFRRGVCPHGAACELSHDVQPCRHWAAGACTRGAHCPFIHAGAPGSAAAVAAYAGNGGEAGSGPGVAVATQFRRFTAEQASRFRQLVASPDAAQHMEELRRLVGPLVPLTFGEPPGTGGEAGADLGVVKDNHARNCGCSECRAQREATGNGGGAAEATAVEAAAQCRVAVEAVLATARTVTAPQSIAMWRSVLGGLRRG